MEEADGALVDEATVVVSREKPVDDDTVVVDRKAASKAKPARVPRGRQRINLPPVEPGFAEQAVLVAGPGAVESYAPRRLPSRPVGATSAEQSVGAARLPAEAVPSVRKASRRFGFVAILGFVVACAVSVVGLTVIAVAVLRGF